MFFAGRQHSKQSLPTDPVVETLHVVGWLCLNMGTLPKVMTIFIGKNRKQAAKKNIAMEAMVH